MTEGFENSWVLPVDQGALLFVNLVNTAEHSLEKFAPLAPCR